LQIRPKPIANKEEYTYYEPQDEVESIVRESTKRGNDIAHVVKPVGGETKEVSKPAATQQLREGVRELAAGGNRAATQRALLEPHKSVPQAPVLHPSIINPTYSNTLLRSTSTSFSSFQVAQKPSTTTSSTTTPLLPPQTI
jgi:hypothetical protein